MEQLARTPEQIGATIRRQRRQRDWNQGELARRAGLRQQTISVLENGHPAARMDTVLAVLAALELEFRIAPRSSAEFDSIEELF